MKNSVVFALGYFSTAFVLLKSLPYVLPEALVNAYICASCTFLSVVIAYYFFPLFKKKFCHERVLSVNKAVLITGCDSGFGHELAKRLDTRGFRVFATCLFPDGDGANSLRAACSDRLRILYMDVTIQNSIEEAVTFVKNNLDKSELWAVVNNAGVYQGYDVACTKIECFQRCLDVNSMGPVRVTKAFLPLLRMNKGRVVTVTSLAGRVALPYLGAYNMSKFAAVAFTESLRLELQPWGIQVISIEPELFRTMICNPETLAKETANNRDSLDEDTLAAYGSRYFDEFAKRIKRTSGLSSNKIYKVIDCLEDAITLEQPNYVYTPCRNLFFSILVGLMKLFPKIIQEYIIRCYLFIFAFPEPKEAGSDL